MVKNHSQKTRRQHRVRKKLRQVSSWPRLSVFRSSKHIYGQIIDDKQHQTKVAVSDKELDKASLKKSKKDQAEAVGKLLAEKALKAKIKVVKFDRGSYKYHGRVKALAEGARAGGLKL